MTLNAPGWARTAADGAWDRLGGLEVAAFNQLNTQLAAFEAPFRDVYEAGVIVPVLRAKGSAKLDVKPAALFHRRVLNDLRGVWVMLRLGYTSQAASVAASLYECALAAVCLLQSEANVKTFMADPHLEIPCKITDMAKMAAQGEGHIGKDFENQWRALYAHYVWLCQIKHASRQSVIHDTTGTALKEGYVVMALPNIRSEDLPVKANVAIIALHRSMECIEAFARALGFDKPWPVDHGFAVRLDRAREMSWKAFEPFLTSAMPVDVASTRFAKKHPPVA